MPLLVHACANIHSFRYWSFYPLFHVNSNFRSAASGARSARCLRMLKFRAKRRTQPAPTLPPHWRVRYE